MGTSVKCSPALVDIFAKHTRWAGYLIVDMRTRSRTGMMDPVEALMMRLKHYRRSSSSFGSRGHRVRENAVADSTGYSSRSNESRYSSLTPRKYWGS